MLLGHAGDRRVQADGSAYVFDTSDSAMERLANASIPIENCPGAYGASTPALDTLVDGAVLAGAYGACLTGAGLAGSVLALCPRAQTDGIAETLREMIASKDYAARAGLFDTLSKKQVEESVVVNRATAGAGEIQL
jgi:galactokinase